MSFVGSRRLLAVALSTSAAIALFAAGAQAAGGGSGSIPLTGAGVSYVQDFNTLATSGTSNALPSGWFFEEAAANANTLYTAGTGSSNAGDTYSFGATSSVERALGGLQSGTLIPTVGAQFVNNTGQAIGALNIAYTGEQWRVGTLGRPDRLDFQISASATSLTTGTWSDVDALDFTGPDQGGVIGLRNGNGATNRTAVAGTISGLSIASGATFWVRWTDFNATGADDGLAVDDISVTPAGDAAPFVQATTPPNSATNVPGTSNITVTFSEPVTVTDPWFTITCPVSGTHSATVSGGPTTYTLDPIVDFASGETCTVSIAAASVRDQDTTDPPDNMASDYTFSFETAEVFECGDPANLIHDVQGSGLTSPLAGTPVVIEGVVVGDYQNATTEFGGFYVQEETADTDSSPATSEGIFVFDNNFGVAVTPGDVVRVKGTATEFSGLTEVNAVSRVKHCGTDSVAPTNVSLPVPDINDLEPFEGMLVHFSQTLTATETFTLGRFGEVSLSGAGRLFTPTAVAAPGAAANAVADQNNRSRIILDDGNGQQNIDPTRYPQGGLSASNTLRVGDTLSSLDGVMDYRFGAYRIQPVGPIAFDHTNPRPAAPDSVGGNLKVASFNVLNFFNGNGLGGGFPTPRGANTAFEFQRQLAKETSALVAMDADIVGLMEMENDAPPHSAIEDLVNSLNNTMGAGTYSFIDTGVIGTDEIRAALIYKPASVTPVGAYKTITTAVDPRFIDTKNRPSLAQTFAKNSTGARLTVVVNHLKSKGSDCNDVGDPDTGDGSGNCNRTRTMAAAALVDWLATDPTGSGDPDFLLIGDMNSYTFEDPITTFTNGGLRNLVREFDGMGAYSYVFNGESGYLDHALATSSLAGQTSGVGHWHINPAAPTVLDYNTEFKTANQVNTFYSPGPYRSSDHDPVLIGLNLNAPPTVDAGGPYTVDEGGTVRVSASGSDPDGGTLTYAWDLDNDGAFDDATGANATFSAAGLDGPTARTIRVRATDAGGLSAVDEATVNVENVAPTATFVAPPTALAGAPFALALTNPHDPSSTDTAAGFTYAFDCGNGYGAFTSSSSTVCSTTATGPRNVGGKIRDKDGGTTEYRATVQIQVTAASLCTLTRLYVQKNDGLANSFCVKLEHGSYDAYENEVRAQSGKALTPEQADVLIALARVLAG
jgi:predicted extracellular nuclease